MTLRRRYALGERAPTLPKCAYLLYVESEYVFFAAARIDERALRTSFSDFDNRQQDHRKHMFYPTGLSFSRRFVFCASKIQMSWLALKYTRMSQFDDILTIF